MNKNNNVIQAKNQLMEEYLFDGRIKECRLPKGFAILTSEKEKSLDLLTSLFKSTDQEQKFDINSIEKGITNAFHITIQSEKDLVKSNIFVATSESDSLHEHFEKVMKDKKVSKCGIKKVVSIILNNKVTYKAIAEESLPE